MNYQKHYELLIGRAKNRAISGYFEVHHILPRCMGGSDARSNLAKLTPEEHFVAHQLLCKIHPDVKGLAFALVNMYGNPHGQRSNKLYGWIRRKVAAAASAQMKEMLLDPVFRKKWEESVRKSRSDPECQKRIAEIVSKTHKGRVKSEQERRNIAEAGRKRKPRIFSEQARENMRAARLKTWEERRLNGTLNDIGRKTATARRANGSYSFTEEHRRNIGISGLGRTPWNKGHRNCFSEETIQKMRNAKLEDQRKRKRQA